MKKQNVVQQDTFVKLRGLPYRVSHDEIEQFFDGKKIILLIHYIYCFCINQYLAKANIIKIKIYKNPPIYDT